MINTIIELLKSNKKIYAWNVKSTFKDSYQLYFIKQNLDMNREVVVTNYEVTIFTKATIKGKEKIGTASFNIYPSMSVEEIKNQIDDHITLCQFTYNLAFVFPKKATIKQVSKEIGFSGMSLKDAAFVAADALFEADKYDKGYINSAEIFINHVETQYYDNNGNHFSYINQYGQIEIVTTWAEKNEEIELYKFIEFDSLEDDYIRKETNKLLLQAGNRIKAIKTPELNNCKLLLTGEYVKDYFYHFALKARTDSIYNHISDVKIGYDFHKKSNKSDRISLRAEPTLKHSTKGAPYDNEGIALRKLYIIEKGIVKNLWGSNANSQYINKPVNGTYSNFVAGVGTLTPEELEEENYVEIIQLSGFEVDAITGDFGSEIRLAYLYQKNKERQVITGGSISGNIYDSIETVRFSNEIEQHNNFIGPKSVLLEKVKFNSGE